MENLIQKYLKEHNVEGKNGIHYRLEDSGNGIEIKDWTLQIAEPSFTQEEIDEAALKEAKEVKIKEIKAKRDALLNQTYDQTIDGETLQFNLHYSNLPILEAKLKDLHNDVDTDTFTTVDNREIHLNRVFFENYIREIKSNDRNAFSLAAAKIRQLTALTTLIAVENFNTNLI